MSGIQLVLSEDGSHTLYLPHLDEHYHSTHGAINESMHVYIQSGLRCINKGKVKVLEVGFGTGLNALLTILNKQHREIHYTTYEKFPLTNDVWQQLNYGSLISPLAAQLFQKIHQASWEQTVEVDNGFVIEKINMDFNDATLAADIDVVYFDAFAPNKQNDLWCFENFTKIFNAMLPGGVLVTYCAKGEIRRMLMQAGFTVERLPGPPHKRQMLRAVKQLL